VNNLEETFRWFGPADPVTLTAIAQSGATGVVTALYHIPVGEIWGLEEIIQRKTIIEEAGLSWSVVESVNIHESIKTASADRDKYIENYISTLQNLASAGITTVCYNFMPVLDWTRTDLDYLLPNKGTALRYDAKALAAFDLYILERNGARDDYSSAQQQIAKQYLDSITPEERTQLINNLMAGLPGTDKTLSISEFKEHLNAMPMLMPQD